MKGTVYKRAGASTWNIKYDAPPGPDGKRRQKEKGGFPTKKAAQVALTETLQHLHSGTYTDAGKVTVGEFLKLWLDNYAKANVVASTLQRYDEIIRLHLTPTLGHVLLARLNALQIQTYYTQALQSGRKDGTGGLSAQTVLHHHRLLHTALEHAVKWKLLSRNPSVDVDPPQPVKKEASVVDADGSAELLEAAEGTWLFLPILIGIATGLRRGEVLAVRWTDVSLTAGVLTVRQSLSETRERFGGLHFKEPKTSNFRTFRLPALVVEELAAERERQAERKEMLGAAYQDQGLVIAQDDGTPRRPDNLSHAYMKLRLEVGSNVTFQGLRHSSFTQALMDGVPLKVVSGRAGHSTIRLTADRYGHILPVADQEDAQKADTRLRAAIERRRQRKDDQGDQEGQQQSA